MCLFNTVGSEGGALCLFSPFFAVVLEFNDTTVENSKVWLH